MRLEYYPKEKLKAEIQTILAKYVDLKDARVFVFGSRVTDRGDDRSDIDIGIYTMTPIPYHIMAEIQEEIDNLPTLYSIDIVDFNRASEDFKKVALQKTETLL